MSTATIDTRPPAGWSQTNDGRPTFVQHDASFWTDDAPVLAGYEPSFVARHGHSFTRWTYKPTEA